MRVKISYGVGIEEVPTKIQDLLTTSAKKLENAMRLIQRMSEDLDNCEENSLQILGSVDKVRNILSEVDLTIADTEAILQGLNIYYNGEQHVPDRRPTMDSSRNTTTETEDTRGG